MPVRQQAADPVPHHVAGTGEPVLCLPGLGAGREAWPSGTHPLAARCQVIAVDYGATDYPACPMGADAVRAMARDAVDLLDHLEIATASLVGTCLGGMTAQAVAGAYPNRVNRVALVATSSYLDTPALDLLDAFERVLEHEGVMACVAAIWQSGISPRFRVEAASLLDDLLRRAADSPPSRAGLLGQLAAMRACYTSELLPRIQVPALVVAAAEDALFSKRHSEALAAALPNAVLRTVPGGHCCWVEAGEALTGVLAEFLLAE